MRIDTLQPLASACNHPHISSALRFMSKIIPAGSVSMAAEGLSLQAWYASGRWAGAVLETGDRRRATTRLGLLS